MARIPSAGRAALGIMLGLALTAHARAQGVGYGASPGRASYRPPAQWNNGPYYTTPHVNPYGPHLVQETGLISNEPNNPPYSSAPRGTYGTFDSTAIDLKPYADGFSPYSGFAGWYARTYNFRPTDEDVLGARAAFFRSAPRPPVGVLTPLPGIRRTPPRMVLPAPARALPPKVETPSRGARPATIPIYRSSVAGS